MSGGMVLKSLKELSSLTKRCTFLAGGTDLFPLLREGKLKNNRFCDLSRLSDLKKISEKEGRISIGALCTFRSIAESRLLKEKAPCLVRAAQELGSPQIRNRATIGGNIANASPAADSIPPLFVLEGLIETSLRTVAVKDFFKGPGATVLKKNELIKRILIPAEKKKSGFMKIGARKSLAVSKVSVAVSAVTDGNYFKKVRIAFGAVGPTVMRAKKTEKFLKGKPADKEIIYEASLNALSEISPVDDFRCTCSYRRNTAAVIFRRLIAEVI